MHDVEVEMEVLFVSIREINVIIGEQGFVL
jgi:hypothetical protein